MDTLIPSDPATPDSAIPILFPELGPRDRSLFHAAVQHLQAHSALAAFDPENESAQQLFEWADRHFSHLESWFRASGVGLRRHEGFPVIQLALEGEAASHPLRRRLDKEQTGLLICLWLLYHELAHQTEGFRIIVTIEEIYARLASLFHNDRRWPETPFREALHFLEKHSLVETNLEDLDFTKGEVALLPTLLTTFRFADTTDAQTMITVPAPAEAETPSAPPPRERSTD